MPVYEYYCDKCRKEVTVPMTMSQHDKGDAVCPQCGGSGLQPLIGSFFAKTSRKS